MTPPINTGTEDKPKYKEFKFPKRSTHPNTKLFRMKFEERECWGSCRSIGNILSRGTPQQPPNAATTERRKWGALRVAIVVAPQCGWICVTVGYWRSRHLARRGIIGAVMLHPDRRAAYLVRMSEVFTNRLVQHGWGSHPHETRALTSQRVVYFFQIW